VDEEALAGGVEGDEVFEEDEGAEEEEVERGRTRRVVRGS
jgi:hypothetical protein